MKRWTTKRFAEVLDIRNGRNQREVESADGRYPILGSAGKIMGYASEYICEAGTTIIGRKGTINSPVFSETRFWNVDTAFGLSPKECLHGKYLYYFCQMYDFSQHNRGTTIPSLVKSDLMGIEMPLPPLEEQCRIVAVLDEAFAATATATANAEQNLANARELFEKALGAAFADLASSGPERSMGEIAAIKGGKRVPKGYKLLSEATPYPYLTVGDFTEDGTIDPSKVRFVSEDIHNQIKRYIIRTEDLYVSIAGTIGRTGIVSSEFDGAQLTENACRLVFNNAISNKFVYFFTKSAAFRRQAIEQTRTAAQPKLALSRLEQIRLPVPDLEVQKRMIERFSELQDSTANLADVALKKLELLAALKQCLLHRALMGELTDAVPEAIAA